MSCAGREDREEVITGEITVPLHVFFLEPPLREYLSAENRSQIVLWISSRSLGSTWT